MAGQSIHHVQRCPFAKKVTLLISSLSLAMVGLPQTASAAINPMQVNELISQAIQTHPKVGAAIADQQATTEGITAAKLGLLPTPAITSGYDKNDGMISRASIRQPLWSSGKLTASVNQAIYDDKAAVATIYEQQNTVAKSTIDIWQNYIYALALQRLYTQNLNRLNEFESMMQRRVGQGVSAKIELDLITNRILQDQNSYQGAIEQQRIAEARLSQLIGETVASPKAQYVPLDALANAAKRQATNFEQMAFDSRTLNNPSVIKEQYQIEAAKQQVKIQESSRYPTIYAQYEDVYYHKTNNNDGQFSLGLSYEPGAGFSNMALARASQARVQSLIQSQESARRTVIEDIQTQYQQFVSAKDQELSLIAAVAGANIVVDSYKRQFIAGRKSWLEVLNAVREQAQYQQQLLQVQSQIVANFYKLQVDFGVMPWQQNSNAVLNTPVGQYHPYQELADWIKNQSKNNQKSMNHSGSGVASTSKNQLLTSQFSDESSWQPAITLVADDKVATDPSNDAAVATQPFDNNEVQDKNHSIETDKPTVSNQKTVSQKTPSKTLQKRMTEKKGTAKKETPEVTTPSKSKADTNAKLTTVKPTLADTSDTNTNINANNSTQLLVKINLVNHSAAPSTLTIHALSPVVAQSRDEASTVTMSNADIEK